MPSDPEDPDDPSPVDDVVVSNPEAAVQNGALAEVLVVDSDDDRMEVEEIAVASGLENKALQNGVDSDSSIEIEAELPNSARPPHVKKRRKIAWQCINPGCNVSRKENLITADSYVLSCFQVKHDDKKKMKVCQACHDTLTQTKEDLLEKLARGEPILGESLPVYRDMVMLEDSDERSETDESLSTDCELDLGSSEGEGVTLEQHLARIVEESLQSLDVDAQVTASCAALNDRLLQLQPIVDETNQIFKDLELQIDKSRKALYQDFQPRVEILDELIISEDAPLPGHGARQQHPGPNEPAPGETAVGQPPAAKSAAQLPLKGIQPVTQQQLPQQGQQLPFVPPPGPLERPPLAVRSPVFAMKQGVLSVWKLGKVDEIVPSGDDLQYKVQFELEAAGKKSLLFDLKQLAYAEPAKWKLPVGTRCIGLFKENQNQPQKSNYYSGIVAEPPKSTNKNRYLVFFDDGYASYIPHNEIRVVCRSSLHVWDDIHPNSRDFIKSYLDQYPERPMVKLTPKQVVKTEWDGKWWITTVMEVDSSLVKLVFGADSREEWIYRGSTRLGPLYTEMEQQRQRREQQASGSMHRRQAYRKPGQNVPFIQYTRMDPPDLDQNSETSLDADGAPARKATNVARKSTTSTKKIEAAPAQQPATKWEMEGTAAEIQINSVPALKYKKHQCSPRCTADLSHQYDEDKFRGSNPLVIPLLVGWQRLICRPSKKKSKIMYVAPCGRNLRNLEEAHRYLRITESKLEIDFFCFDWYCKVILEFQVKREVCSIKDLSYGKENVPISCVNSIDKNYPEYLEYSTKRLPKEKVFINTDDEFLVSCDCIDDCQDKESCACHQLTIQATECGHTRKVDSSVGYQFRRLQQVVLTGIYECNKKCSCAKTCLNRVAQNPLRQKLQVFKTERRGWGMRTLCDLPKGAFICIYVGNLFESEEANKQGQNFGDEYFADLDMIETVERQKEGYESDVSDIEDDDLPQYEGSTTPAQSSVPPADVTELSSEDEEEISYDRGDDDKDFNPVKKIFSSKADRKTRLKRGVSQLDGGESTPSGSETERSAAGSRPRGRPRRDSAVLAKPQAVADTGRRRSRLSDLSQVDGTADKSDEDTEVVDVKVGRRGGGFTATVGITGPKTKVQTRPTTFKSTRKYFGLNEDVYIMDAKSIGNIGRYLNHSCEPNVFVQNVFVDTHDLRFPWVAFFSSQFVRAGQELCWDYNYEVGSIPGKELYCACGADQCKGRLL